MSTCDQWRDLIWDDLYGLLDADQAQLLRRHVTVCPACQAAQKTAESQQQLIARMTRLDVDVPMFVPPADDAAARPPSGTARGAVSTFYAPPRLRIAASFVAAAAAALLFVVLPYGLYRGERTRHETALEEARERLAALQADRQAAYRVAVADQEAAAETARGRHLRLQVVGPAGYQPGAPNPHRVLVTDLNGKAADATLTARVLGPDGRVLHETTGESRGGTLLVALPGDLPAGQQPLRLELLAVSRDVRESFRDDLPAAAARYVTHLTLSKVLLTPGDTLLFRSLTLDRFTLTPPAKPLSVTYTLRDPSGTALLEQQGRLRPEDGVGGGAFLLPAQHIKAGEYSLTIATADGSFPPQTRKFHVHGEQKVRLRKVLELDRPWYQAGDVIRANLRVERLQTGEPATNRPVIVTLKVDGTAVAASTRLQTDAKGIAAIQLKLPEKAEKTAQLIVVVDDGRPFESVERTIPLGVPKLAVEFFPEGGDLIAGVPNRVYFRARTAHGQPAEVQGMIVDPLGRNVAAAVTADAGRGLGLFEFTPEAGATYSLVLPQTAKHLAGPHTHELPAVRESGVVLCVPRGVVKVGEPLETVLHSTGETRRLLVGAWCRDRLVAQEAVTVQPGRTEVRLALPPNLGGVLRLTVFEEGSDGLRPLAERLVYRATKERLQLSARTDKPSYPEGGPVQLTVNAAREDGQPEPAWLLVAVVDPEATGVAGARPVPSLPAFFHLSADLDRPEDLEDADFLLTEHPRAEALLDLYLGTQGWRRFATRSSREVVQVTNSRQRSEGAALVLLDNLEQVRRRYETALPAALAAVRQTAEARDRELFHQEKQRAAAVTVAAGALSALEDRTRDYLNLGLTTLVVTLVVAVGLFVALSLARNWSTLTIAVRPYFAGAAGVLAVCGLCVWVLLGRGTEVPLGGGEVASLTLPEPKALALEGTPRQTVAQAAARPAAGTLPTDDVQALRERKALAVGLAGRPLRTSNVGNVGTIASIPPNLDNPPHRPPVVEGAPERPLIVREYAYTVPKIPAGEELPDVLLWHPVLHAANGTAQATFELPRRNATYQILIQGHSPSGRLGVFRTELKAPAK